MFFGEATLTIQSDHRRGGFKEAKEEEEEHSDPSDPSDAVTVGHFLVRSNSLVRFPQRVYFLCLSKYSLQKAFHRP